MENHKIESILKPMIGKMWLYKKENVLLKNFNIGANVVKLYCDGSEPITILIEDFDSIINTFYPSENDNSLAISLNNRLTSDKDQLLPVRSIINKHGDSLADTILLNIQRVKADPGYIPQANEVNNQIKTLIDLAKTEIEMLKVAASLRR